MKESETKIYSPAEETAVPYTDRELFQRALENLPHVIKKRQNQALWMMVSDLFGCGQDVAYRICWRSGFDPDRNYSSIESFDYNWRDLDDGK